MFLFPGVLSKSRIKRSGWWLKNTFWFLFGISKIDLFQMASNQADLCHVWPCLSLLQGHWWIDGLDNAVFFSTVMNENVSTFSTGIGRSTTIRNHGCFRHLLIGSICCQHHPLVQSLQYRTFQNKLLADHHMFPEIGNHYYIYRGSVP